MKKNSFTPRASKHWKQEENKIENDLNDAPALSKDVIAFGIFPYIPVKDLPNAFRAGGKSIYKHNDRIHYLATINRLENAIKNACSQDNLHDCRFRDENILTNRCIQNYLDVVCTKLNSPVIKHDLILLPKIIAQHEFNAADDFDFWQEVHKFLIAKTLEKEKLSKENAYAVLGCFLFELPAEKIIPLKLTQSYNIDNTEFKTQEIADAFCYAHFSQYDIEQLVRLNPNILKQLIDGIEDDNILSPSFHTKSSSRKLFLEKLQEIYLLLIRLGLKPYDNTADKFLAQHFVNEYDFLKSELIFAQQFHDVLKKVNSEEKAKIIFLKLDDPDFAMKSYAVEKCLEARQKYKHNIETIMNENKNIIQNVNEESRGETEINPTSVCNV